MKALLTRITSAAAAGFVLLIGAAMAGLGLTVMAVLALFAMAAFGFALIAAPFLRVPEPGQNDLGPDWARPDTSAG